MIIPGISVKRVILFLALKGRMHLYGINVMLFLENKYSTLVDTQSGRESPVFHSVTTSINYDSSISECVNFLLATQNSVASSQFKFYIAVL